MEKRLFIVTGSPGIGKTTVLSKIIDVVKERSYSVGGMLTSEVRVAGVRIGFEMLDVCGGKKGWLARTDQKEGPHIRKYQVNLQDLDTIGAKAILQAVTSSDIIVIDEVGPMELFSDKFAQAVVTAIDSTKPLVCIVHWKIRNQFIEGILRREDAETFTVNEQNRNRLPENIADKITKLLGTQKGTKDYNLSAG
jgi:nucleoside-triphosphatase